MPDRARVPFWFLVLNSGLGAFGIFVLAAQAWHFFWPDLPAREMTMLRLVYQRVIEEHVEEHDGHKLMQDAIAGMVQGLDKYSAFIPPAKVSAFEEQTTGEFQGIGISMLPNRAPITVHFPFQNGPAAMAGLEVGDEIVAIDGERLDGIPADEINRAAEQRLKGRVGTRVRLTIARGDAPSFDTDVVRGPVQKHSVKWARLLDAGAGLGYVYVSAFQHDTVRELDEEMGWLERQAKGSLRGLVVDLRDDPGGLLTECLAFANRFQRSGLLVSLRRRGGEETERHVADPRECRWPDLPLVLLVDGGSASASEVVAGALADHHRARLVGTRTFGKGVVQSIFQWRDLDFRLKLTTSYYYTPAGHNIGRLRASADGKRGGIEPDLVVAVDPHRASKILDILVHAVEVPRPYRAAAAQLEARHHLTMREPLGPDEDPQLAAALQELRHSKQVGSKTR